MAYISTRPQGGKEALVLATIRENLYGLTQLSVATSEIVK